MVLAAPAWSQTGVPTKASPNAENVAAPAAEAEPVPQLPADSALQLPADSAAGEPPVAEVQGEPGGAEPTRSPVVPTTAACFPECRAGYLCAEGKCISACNPSCSDGFECTADRRCVLPPSAEGEDPATELPPDDAVRPDQTKRKHDGFYLRAGIELGMMLVSVSPGGDTRLRTGGGGFLLAAGATVSPGLVIGAGFYGITGNRVSSKGASPPDSMSMNIFGMLYDWFPDPSGGFHLINILGIGGIETEFGADEDVTLEPGLGVSVGAGYDFWVSSQGSVGVQAQLAYVHRAERRFDDDSVNGTFYSGVSPTLAVSYLWH